MDARADFDIRQHNTFGTDAKRQSGSHGTLNRKQKMVICRVILLDKDNFEAEISKSAFGQQLFDKVKEKLNLDEADFFGLSYYNTSGLRFWLSLDKRVDKQLDSNPWVFSFEVKFYPPEPNILSSDDTRYLLVLQVRQDLLSGRLPCSFHTHALLGSYTIQSELGDYSSSEHGGSSGNSIEYLRPYLFAPNQSDELLYRIADLHRLHKGLLPEEADLLLLDSAKKLALYGVDLYKTKDINSRDTLVGVSAAGLYIYEDRLRMDTFKWPRILKVSYKRNLFNVKVRSLEFDKEEHLHGFKCGSPKLAKRLWRITVETHQFFRLKQPELTDTKAFSGFGTKRWRMSGRTLHEMRHQGSNGSTLSRTASRSTSRDTLTPTARRAGSVSTLPSDVMAKKKLVDGARTYGGESEQADKVGEVAPVNATEAIGNLSSSSRSQGNSVQRLTSEKRLGPGDKSKCMVEDDFHDTVEYNLVSGALSDTVSTTDSRRVLQCPSPTSNSEGMGSAVTEDDVVTASVSAPVFSAAPPARQDVKVNGGPLARISQLSVAAHGASGSSPGDVPLPAFALASVGVNISGLLSGIALETSERGEKVVRIGLPPTVRTTSVRYNPSVDSAATHTTREVPIVRTLSRSHANGYYSDEGVEGQLVSSVSHSSQSQTTETTTYTTEKDGFVEKRMTTKITIVSDNAEDIDYDKALLDAIQRVTNMDPNLAVEKIEIKTEDTS